MQRVKIYLQICGDYVSFGETGAHVLYDITNDIMVDTFSYESLDEIKELYEKAMAGTLDYCDVDIVDAIRTDEGEYFYKIR
jgi:hypothetical protein